MAAIPAEQAQPTPADKPGKVVDMQMHLGRQLLAEAGDFVPVSELMKSRDAGLDQAYYLAYGQLRAEAAANGGRIAMM